MCLNAESDSSNYGLLLPNATDLSIQQLVIIVQVAIDFRMIGIRI